MEWARFRMYARRMRELRGDGDLVVLSLDALSALQLRTINEPLLPNLKTLSLYCVPGPLVPFIPLFLSLRVTTIRLNFKSGLSGAMIASIVTTIPTLCPNLQVIDLPLLRRDPMITAAFSKMVLATNQNTLQGFRVGSPLKEEAREVVYKLPNLRDLLVHVVGETSLPSASLPNLTKLEITCDDNGGWLQLFHGATFGKLESVVFYDRSKKLGDFLGAFERAAFSSSIQNTLSKFHVFTSCSWNPNYSSLLSFTQLVRLEVDFPCSDGCSSRVDDDIVTDLSRAMPKLQVLRLGGEPCRELTVGVTAKGLTTLALHCLDLRYLRIHFQVASLSVLPASPGISRSVEPAGSCVDCALTTLAIGETRVPKESVSTVALTLLRIFPHIEWVYSNDRGWGMVWSAIYASRRIIGCSSKHYPLATC